MAQNFWRGSHYLEWILDRQDVLIHRLDDLKLFGTEEEYQKIMIFFTGVIQAIGKSIEVRQQVIATAIVYFKRFYSRTSLKSIDPWLLAPTCIFLASKIEEFGVLSQKSYIASCRSVVQNLYSSHLPEAPSFPYRVQDILECEFILLEAMDCSLVVFHPYRSLVLFCEELKTLLAESTDPLLERAWSIVNDSLLTDTCLHYPPYLVALGCLLLAFAVLPSTSSSSGTSAAHHHHQPHSNTSSQQQSSGPLNVANQWFTELNVDMDKVVEVANHVLSLYDLLRRFDESSEMPVLLKKLPAPEIQQPPQSSQSFPPSSTSSSSQVSGKNAAAAASNSHLRFPSSSSSTAGQTNANSQVSRITGTQQSGHLR